MGWQEDEAKRRNGMVKPREKSEAEIKEEEHEERRAVLNFWNKLIEANKKLLPEVRATVRFAMGQSDWQIMEGLQGTQISYCELPGSTILVMGVGL